MANRTTYKAAAADPRSLGFDYASADISERNEIGELVAEDGSVSKWTVVPAESGGCLLEISSIEDGEEKDPVLFVPVHPVPAELELGEDYMPTTYDTVADAYAAFLEVAYADDAEDEGLVRVCLSNETTASGFYYDVSRPVLAVLERVTETELSEIMPSVSSGERDEHEKYASALEERCLKDGLPPASVIVKPVDTPTFWFNSGWAYSGTGSYMPPAAVDGFPCEIEIPAGAFSDAASEWEYCNVIDGLLPEGLESWGFGDIKCLDRITVSVVKPEEGREASPDNGTFAAYMVVDGGAKLELVGDPEAGEGSLFSEYDGHKVTWNPELAELEDLFAKTFRG